MIIILSFRRRIYFLGENAEIYIIFSVPKEVTKIHKIVEESTDTISFRLQLIDSARFKASSLSNLLIILLLKEFIKLNVNADIMIKNVKLAELNTKIATAFLDTQTLKMI